MATWTDLPDPRPWHLPADTMLPACPFGTIPPGGYGAYIPGPHDFDAHTVDGFVMQQSCRKCGLLLPIEIIPDGESN